MISRTIPVPGEVHESLRSKRQSCYWNIILKNTLVILVVFQIESGVRVKIDQYGVKLLTGELVDVVQNPLNDWLLLDRNRSKVSRCGVVDIFFPAK